MESEKVKEIKKALEVYGKENKGITILRGGEIQAIPYTDILTLINELESENKLLRNAKVVYETVDYCYEDLKKAEKRIAELEEENKEQLKQFAKWLVDRSNNVVYEKLVLEYINERIKG